MRFGIALGSNLQDRLALLRFGRTEVLTRSGGQCLAQSSVYETEPVDCPPGSLPFLNAVLEIECALSPEDLLTQTQAIERAAGRIHSGERNAPRPLDLDLLYADALVLQDEALVLPHPRLHLRRFVLAPLAEIRPELKLPGMHAPVAHLLAGLSESEEPEPGLYCQDW